MSNFFGAIADRVGDLVSKPVSLIKDTIKNPKEGLKEWGDLYTHNTHKDQDLFQNGLGIRGWVGDHPQESAAAVVGSIFGGWMAAGAYGGAAAGGAGTAAGASGAGATAGVGTAAGASGTAATGLGSGVGFGSATTGATGYGAGSIGATPFATGSATLSYAPSSASILGGSGGSLTAGGTVGAGSAGATAGTGFGSTSVGAMPFSEGSSVLGYEPSAASFGDLPASSGSEFDLQQFIQGVQRLNSATGGNKEQSGSQQQSPQVQAPQRRQTQLQAMQTPYGQAYQTQQQLNQSNPFDASNNPFMGGR